MCPVGVLCCLGGTEEGLVSSLRLLHSTLLGDRLRTAHSSVASHLLHSVVVAILQSDKALCNLEEIAIGLVGGKVDVEDESAVGLDLLLGWKHLEGVLH